MHASGRWWVRALVGSAELVAIIGLMVLLVQMFGTRTDIRVTNTLLINLTAAVALQTYMGPSGIISFGHAGFMALGAYGSALFSANPKIKASAIPDAPAFILEAQLPFLPAILIGVATAVIVAAVIGRTFVRLSGSAAAVATLGLMVVVFTVLSNAEWLTRGSKAFSGIPPYATTAWCFAGAAFAIVVARLLRDSDYGLGLRSSRDDAIAAEASGVDIYRSRFLLWLASAGLSAIAGALYAHTLLAILPQAFQFQLTFLIVTMVIIGGQSITGAVVGTAAVTLLAEMLRRAENVLTIGGVRLSEQAGLTTIVLGLLIVLMLTLRPQGLLGRWEIDELAAHVLKRRRARADMPEGLRGAGPA
jgi:branched-chain amino acid transport system permease protein